MAGKGKGRFKLEISAPTAEQMGAGAFVLSDILDTQKDGRRMTIGKAYKRVRMLETLFSQGLFSPAEYKALKHYQHHADTADKSSVRDSLCIQRTGGSGQGPSVTLLNAQRVRDDCERAAGSLADILRAVVVNDQSLSEFAMSRHGAFEQCRQRKGERVCTMEPRRKALDIAKQDIKMAAQRVEAELSA